MTADHQHHTHKLRHRCDGDCEKSASSKLSVLDLFSGVGAYSLGLERTGGFQTVAFCEVDEWCGRLLSQHWPRVPNLGDVTQQSFEGIEADVIVGGFPCQDISNAGKRAGLAGARSGLFWEMVRAIRLVRPAYVIMENVAALLDRGRGMGVVLGTLAEDGYDAEWDCLSCSDIGAPHGRPRVFIAAADRHRAKWPQRGREAIRPGQRGAQESVTVAPNRDGPDLGEGSPVPVQGRQWVQAGGREPAADANRVGQLEPPRLLGKIRRWIDDGAHRAFWSCDWQTKFETLRRMDVRSPTRLDRARDSAAIGHLGNSNPPQFLELIGRAILAQASQEAA